MSVIDKNKRQFFKAQSKSNIKIYRIKFQNFKA